MKILLVPNNPGWAFDHISKDLLSLKFSTIKIDLKYRNSVKKSDQYHYDLIYPMSLPIAKKLQKINIPYNKMATGITSKRVFEKQMTNQKKGFKTKFLALLKQFRGINTASDEIVNIFKPHFFIYKTRVGINEKKFLPSNVIKKNEKFTVGWVGRIDKKNYRELKGYDIVLAALKDLDVQLNIRTYKEQRVPREKMVEFYQNLDCLICSSASEHIPLPVLEAAACGVPIISTKVGIVPEIIKTGENGLIVPGTSEAIRRAVQFLMSTPQSRYQISENIRAAIVENWTWEKCKSDWEKFFLSIR